MSIFNCKMCGGVIDYALGTTVCACQYCGTTQTLPRLDDDRKANLYDRANHHRRNNEYDKALSIYEQILNDDMTDAESYWSIVLCKYGIEYVEDPVTHKRVPTINRAQYTSIFSDENYKKALEYADSDQKAIYEEEAQTIDSIQKRMLEISSREAPFDVFICYKETDTNGRRTQDSVLANDLYFQLVQEGFKVFFSRITLEDKLGMEFEPYIFAALNSAKVMVVLGTKSEYFNATWVKNEWSRFLTLVKQSNGKKVLIPAYKDMDPYDLPEEFSHLQAQDMNKLGFLQDLIRGIKKILSTTDQKTVINENIVIGENVNVSALLKRVFMFLEDGNWEDADEYCERVLDQDPENAQAYLGKLMVEQQVKQFKKLAKCSKPFDTSKNYQKIMRFGDDDTKTTLMDFVDQIKKRNEYDRLMLCYNKAVLSMNSANTEESFRAVVELFKKLPGFKDADLLLRQCLENAEVCRKNELYSLAKSQMAKNTEDGYLASLKMFSALPGWRDVDELVLVCQRYIEQIRKKEEADRIEAERMAEKKRAAEKRAKKIRALSIVIGSSIVVIGIIILIVVTTVIIPKRKYTDAMRLLDTGDYETAYSLLIDIGRKDIVDSSKFDRAIAMIEKGEYINGYYMLCEMEDNETNLSKRYDKATAAIDSEEYLFAYYLLSGMEYKDSVNKLKSIKPNYQKIFLSKAEVGSYVVFGSYEQDNDATNGTEDVIWLVLAKEGNNILITSEYSIDSKKYYISNDTIAWGDCFIRYWLNDDFISEAFTEDEQKQILNTEVVVTDGLRLNVTDKVFLLSKQEVEQYLPTTEKRICWSTNFARAQGAWEDFWAAKDEHPCRWWLRDVGGKSRNIPYVSYNGEISDDNWLSPEGNADGYGIRPAMWISIE